MGRNWFPILTGLAVIVALVAFGGYPLFANLAFGGVSQEDYDLLLGEKTSLQEQLDQAQQINEDVSRELNTLKLQNSQAVKKMQVQQLSDSSDKCNDFEDERDDIEGEIDDLENEIEDLEGEIDDKEQEISDAEDNDEDTVDLEDELTELEDDLESNKDDLDALEEDLDEVKNDLDDENC